MLFFIKYEVKIKLCINQLNKLLLDHITVLLILLKCFIFQSYTEDEQNTLNPDMRDE